MSPYVRSAVAHEPHGQAARKGVSAISRGPCPRDFFVWEQKKAPFHTAPGTGAGKKPLKNDTRPGGRNGLPRERRSWPAVPSPS